MQLFHSRGGRQEFSTSPTQLEPSLTSLDPMDPPPTPWHLSLDSLDSTRRVWSEAETNFIVVFLLHGMYYITRAFTGTTGLRCLGAVAGVAACHGEWTNRC